MRKSAPKQREQSWYDEIDKRQGTGQTTSFEKREFVRGELTAGEKEHCKNQDWKPDEVFNTLDNLCAEGHKVTVQWDSNNDCFVAWLIPTSEGNPNAGLILSARGPSLLASVAVLLYKHFTKFDATWPKPDEKGHFDQWG